MRHLRRNLPHLRRSGPILDITVEPVLEVQELLRQRNQPVPTVRLTALVDTGASGTTIQSSVMEPLGLISIGTAFASTPSTTEPVPCPEYRVRLVLAEGIAFETDVAGVPLGGLNVRCLIGRDILERIILSYNGPGNRFTLKFVDDEIS